MDEHAREIAGNFVRGISEVWAATDYEESRDPAFLSDSDLADFLGKWPDIRRACDQIFETARRERPGVSPRHPFDR